MYAKELLKLLEEEIAPVALSDEYCKNFGHYDNSGIIIDSGESINGILFSLDLSKNSVAEAIKRRANCIVTHHPAIYGGVKTLPIKDDILAANIAECIKKDISVISMHLNFDAAPEGIDYHLMRALGGDEAKLMDKLSVGGYGRVYLVQPVKFKDFALNAARVLNTQRFTLYGDGEKIINRAASFCGAGGDENSAKFACENGADVFVSSEMHHHVIADLVQRGMCVLNLTHYSSENYGFGQIAKKIIGKLSIPAAFYADGQML